MLKIFLLHWYNSEQQISGLRKGWWRPATIAKVLLMIYLTTLRKHTLPVVVFVFSLVAISGCAGDKAPVPGEHAGSDAVWNSFRGNAEQSTGVADEEITPPLAVMWTFEAYGARADKKQEVDIPDTAAPPGRRAAFRSSPVAADDVVVAGSMDGSVYGVNAETGAPIWHFETGDAVIASPLIIDGNVYIGSMNGNFYCLDLKTGEQKRTFTVPRGIKGAAATDGKNIFFGALDRGLYAIDINTFEPAVKMPVKLNPESADPYEAAGGSNAVGGEAEKPGGEVDKTTSGDKLHKLPKQKVTGVVFKALDWIEGAPTVYDGKVYFGSNDGFIYVVRAETGEIVWSYETGNCVYSTPAIVDGTVYFTSWDGNVYALDSETGKMKWKTKIDEQVSASPAVKDGIVVVGGAFDGDLAGLNAETGEIVWRFTTKGGFDAGPVISGNIAYVGSYDDYLYAVNIADGTVVWKKLMKHMIRGSVALANNTVFVGTGAGKLFALVEAE